MFSFKLFIKYIFYSMLFIKFNLLHPLLLMFYKSYIISINTSFLNNLIETLFRVFGYGQEKT
jgi:hypothetical protein